MPIDEKATFRPIILQKGYQSKRHSEIELGYIYVKWPSRRLPGNPGPILSEKVVVSKVIVYAI